MATGYVKIEYNGNVYNPDGTIASYPDTGEPMVGYKDIDPQTGALFYPFSSGVAFGGGYFLTASHSFDIWRPGRFGDRQFRAEEVYIDNVSSKSWEHLRKWESKRLYDATKMPGFENHQLNDLAYIKLPQQNTQYKLYSFVSFADTATINKILSGKDVSRSGAASNGNGIYIETNVEGQFRTSGVSEPGDSGGPGTVKIGDKDYISGLLSFGTSSTNTFSYLKPIEIFKMGMLASSGSTGILQTDHPDLIYSSTQKSEEYYRGTKRKAEFIFNDNKSAVLMGEDSDVVNTGSGTDNIIFLQDALGKSDSGATIVVSPGNDVIVGGSSNDRIVILADRLWKPGIGKPEVTSLKTNSDTIQIRGGITTEANRDGDKFGIYSPVWNPSQSYDENGYYHISYDIKKSGGVNDLIITVYAVDGSSDRAPNPHFTSQYSENLWTSVIRIKNFKDGDFGLTFVEGILTDKYEEAWAELERAIPSSSTLPQASKHNSSDISDNWNGIKPETDIDRYDPSNAYIQSQLNRILEIYKDPNSIGNPESGNRPPQATADAITTGVNEDRVFDLIANDADPDAGDQIKFVSFSISNTSGLSVDDQKYISHAFLIENNKLKFSPDSRFDSLETGMSAKINILYTIEDSKGAQSTGTFNLTVIGENRPVQYGTELDDTIYGSNKSDTIYGYGGNDLLSAWAGNDSLFGGDGDDRLFGHEGDDVLEGGNGNDVLDGGTGNDIMRGGNGSDRYHVDSEFDQIIEVSDGSVNSVTTDVYRYKLVENTHNLMYLGNNDFIGIGNELDNNITGGEKADQLDGGAGNNILRGLGGNDIFYGGLGLDFYDGGDGFDTVDYYSSSSGIRVDVLNPNNNTGDAAGDAFIFVEQWGLTAHNDIFVGSDRVDYVFSLGGSDTLLGGGGDDWLAGGAGADILDGQDGFDTADYTGASAAVTVDRMSVANSLGDAKGDTFISIERFHLSQYDDRFVGSSANEFIYGNGGNDTLLGGDGNDWLIGGTGADALIGGTGYDTASYFSANAAVTIDLVTLSNSVGDAQGDNFSTIEAFQLTANYADRFVGSSAAETVFGGGGNDTLIGNDGNDFLDGEEMNDVLTGGAGTDTFAFYERGFGKDVVTDFVSGDLIEFSNSAFSSFTAVQSSMSQVGADTIITLDNDNMVTLLNVIATNLISTDFRFV